MCCTIPGRERERERHCATFLETIIILSRDFAVAASDNRTLPAETLSVIGHTASSNKGKKTTNYNKKVARFMRATGLRICKKQCEHTLSLGCTFYSSNTLIFSRKCERNARTVQLCTTTTANINIAASGNSRVSNLFTPNRSKQLNSPQELQAATSGFLASQS